MAPSTTQLVQQLRQFIWYNLDNDLVDNALFLAGRLYALDSRNPDSVHILALCHFRAGQLKIAYDYCRTVSLKKDHLGCAYVFAQACLGLEKYSEGIAALEKTRAIWESRAPLGKLDAQRRPMPDAAAFHYVLGKLAQGFGDRNKAIESYVAALKLNPFMWDAYERLCDLGPPIRPSNVFKESNLSASFVMAFDTAPPPRPPAKLATSSDPLHIQGQSTPHIDVSHPADLFNPSKATAEPTSSVGELNLLKVNANTSSNAPTSHAPLMETPPSFSADDAAMVPNGFRANGATLVEPPMAPLRRSRTQASAAEVHSGADVAKLRRPDDKAKKKDFSGDSTDSLEPKKSLLFPPRTTKRTISGTDPNAKAQQQTDPSIPGQRRSVRLFKKAPSATVAPSTAEGEPDHKKVKATGTRGRTTAASTVGRVVSGNRKPLEQPPAENGKDLRNHIVNNQYQPPAPAPRTTIPDVPMLQRPRPHSVQQTETTSALPFLMSQIRPLAQAYYELSRYNPQQALAILNALPTLQRETPYVLSLIGRAHYDLNAYDLACHTFERLRQLAPSQIQHMEIYSTALWHLKADTHLAYLSHELIESSRLAPESWCALGNSFSLQRDHENAIRCFRRATQLAPKFAYAWTQLGHEYVAAEDLDKALLSYRKAVAADRRHYQGLYGLGRVYERLGRFDMAEKHYRGAASINPRNAVLLCCIGTVQDRQGNHAAALATYEGAVALAPQSAMGRFKRARSLLRMRRFEDALAEFLVLKDLAPEEANVHFMLGRVYRALGRKGEAVRCLSGALGLDPKAAPLIKDAMEALGEEDDEMGDAEDEDDEMRE